MADANGDAPAPPSALIQKRSTLYAAREKLVAVEARRESVVKQHAQLQEERERVAHEYEAALVDLNNEFGDQLENASAEINRLKAQVENNDAATAALQREHATQVREVTARLDAERSKTQRVVEEVERLRLELVRVEKEKKAELDAAAAEVAEERAKAAMSEQLAEDLRNSVVKLTGDKFKLWDIHDQATSNHETVRELLGQSQWQKDEEVLRCTNQECNVEFGIFVRRHHCRICGKIFCNDCCAKRAKLMAISDTPVRACNSCNNLLVHVSSPIPKAAGKPLDRKTSIGLLGKEGEEEGFYMAGGKGWTNGFGPTSPKPGDDGEAAILSDEGGPRPNPKGTEASDGAILPAAAAATDNSGDVPTLEEAEDPSRADELDPENPARRRISFEGEAPAAAELAMQRFHAIALEAKLNHPDQTFQQSIESLYELSLQQGVSEDGWSQFIEARIASWSA